MTTCLCFAVGSQVAAFTAASTVCGAALAWYFQGTRASDLVSLGKVEYPPPEANPGKPAQPDILKAA
jgi:hypothetical protein